MFTFSKTNVLTAMIVEAVWQAPENFQIKNNREASQALAC
jgi:hypothetical protein